MLSVFSTNFRHTARKEEHGRADKDAFSVWLILPSKALCSGVKHDICTVILNYEFSRRKEAEINQDRAECVAL